MGIFETEDQFRTRTSSVPLITGAMKQSTLVGRSSCTVTQQRNIVRIEDQYRFLYADDIVPNTCFAPLSRTTWVPKEPRMAPPDATLATTQQRHHIAARWTCTRAAASTS